MALLFMDGLDCYADNADMVKSGWRFDSLAFATLQTTGGRYGGGGIRITTALTTAYHGIPMVTFGGTIVMGIAIKHTGIAAGTIIQGYSDTGASSFKIDFSTTGSILFYTGSSTLVHTSAGSPLTASAWHWVEVKVLADNSGSMECYVDGVLAGTISAVDTQGTGAGINVIRFGGGGGTGQESYWDDIVIMDTTGATMNDYIGDSKITTLTPTSDGGVVDWTASAGADYTCVDEVPNAANDDTDYIESSTAAQESRFNVSNLSAVPNDIWTVQARYRAKKTDAGTRTIRGLANSNGTEQTGPTIGLTTTYAWLSGPAMAVDPDTSAAWDYAGVNALQVGVEVVA